MHQEYQWPRRLDAALKEIESLDRPDIAPWLRDQRQEHWSDATIHLRLALASSRYIDHHGPYIGHGTFNGGPMLRASTLLDQAYRDLALLQTTTYVVDLLQNPNYGPYLLMHMNPVLESTPEASKRAFLQSLEAGDQVLAAEHRMIGLLHQISAEVPDILRYASLLQYGENEHRLLMVHRSLQLVDDSAGWLFAEPILRAATQYLASRPSVIVPESPQWPQNTTGLISALDPIDAKAIYQAIDRLQNVSFGEEPAVIHDLIAQQMNPSSLYEALSLTASHILSQTHFDAHGVTGVHCLMDLLHDTHTPETIRDGAWVSVLSGSRIRRQKAIRGEWRKLPPVSGHPVSLDTIREVLSGHSDGLEAIQVIGNYLLAGGNPRALTQILMQYALTTAGPFDAIHNVKMLWGQLQETQRSRLPQESWRHLAAGARVIVETATSERREALPILDMWHQFHPIQP